MNRSEHMKRINAERAANRVSTEERNLAEAREELSMPEPNAEEPVATAPEASSVDGFTAEAVEQMEADIDADLVRHRMQYDELMEQLKTAHEELRILKSQGVVQQGPAIVMAKTPPRNHVVWLGPELTNGAQLCFAARGRVRMQPKAGGVKMIDGDGMGKERLVFKTEHTGVSLGYISSGYESIEFVYRCPASHRFAGRLWAEIKCPHHAAWLQLTAGFDRDRNKMFHWELIQEWKDVMRQLVEVQMREDGIRKANVDWLMSQPDLEASPQF